MTFEFYLVVGTLVILAVRWVLFLIYDDTPDGPSFLLFMLDPKSHPTHPRASMVASILCLAFVAYGFYAYL